MGSKFDTIRKNKVFLLMVLPATIWFVLFKYLPIFGNVIAFQQFQYSTEGFIGSIKKSAWVGFENFKFLFSSGDAFIITRNTILYNLAFIVIGLLLPVTIAIIFNFIRNRRLSKVYQTGMMLPYFLSWVVVSYFAFIFLSMDKGLLNQVLTFFGADPKLWYNEAKYWPLIIIVVQTWKTVGYSSIIYIAAIAGIDKTYYEAALIDGANKWQQVKSVTLPHLKPVMIILTVLAIGQIFHADFGLFYQVTRNSGLILSTTNVIDTYVYRSMQGMGSFGMSTAAGLYQSVVGFVLVLLANYAVKKVSKDDALF